MLFNISEVTEGPGLIALVPGGPFELIRQSGSSPRDLTQRPLNVRRLPRCPFRQLPPDNPSHAASSELGFSRAPSRKFSVGGCNE